MRVGVASRTRLPHWLTRSVARRIALLASSIATAVATVVGFVVVGVFLGDEPDAVRRQVIFVAIAGGACTVAAVALGTWFIVERKLARRLRELTESVRAAEKGKFLRRAHDASDDELGVLSRAFEHMIGQITDLSVAVIDGDRELAMTRRELKLKEALELLFELTQSLSSDPEGETEAIVRAIPARVAPSLGVGEMAILIADERGQRLTVRATHGFPEDQDPTGMTFDVREGVVGRVAETLATLYIPDTSRDERYLHYKGKRRADGSFVCVPMLSKGKLLGVFNALRPGADGFAAADVRLLESLAGAAALAIAHAQMTARLRDLATTDELTGVPNRRQLMERLAREVDRSQRGGKPLAALMLDIDLFKHINDELGHQRGDEVLRAVAQELARSVRRMDAVARYGGEEFVVLLPETAAEPAFAVAEKLRLAIEALSFPDLSVTVSIGVAVLPDHAPDADSLLGAADRALLTAKRTGRNRVVLGTVLPN